MKIEKIEVYVVGPEDIHYTWSEDIPEVYQSNTIIRIYTEAKTQLKCNEIIEDFKNLIG